MKNKKDINYNDLSIDDIKKELRIVLVKYL